MRRMTTVHASLLSAVLLVVVAVTPASAGVITGQVGFDPNSPWPPQLVLTQAPPPAGVPFIGLVNQTIVVTDASGAVLGDRCFPVPAPTPQPPCGIAARGIPATPGRILGPFNYGAYTVTVGWLTRIVMPGEVLHLTIDGVEHRRAGQPGLVCEDRTLSSGRHVTICY